MEVQRTLSVQAGLLLSSVFDTRVLFPPGDFAGVHTVSMFLPSFLPQITCIC